MTPAAHPFGHRRGVFPWAARTGRLRLREGRRVGVLDIGTFSAKVLIAEVNGQELRALCEERSTLDLARSAAAPGQISRSGIQRILAAARSFAATAKRFRCDQARIVCTAAIRHATNRREVLDLLRGIAPHQVSVVSAREEAILSATGAVTGLRPTRVPDLVVDIGGGSIEVFRPDTEAFRGVRIGVASATERWLPARPHLRARRRDYYRSCASEAVKGLTAEPSTAAPRLIGVGGTVTTLAAIHLGSGELHPRQIHARSLSKSWIARIAAELSLKDRRGIEAMIPFDTERARIMTAGAFLWEAVLNRLGTERVTVSARGVRWGMATILART